MKSGCLTLGIMWPAHMEEINCVGGGGGSFTGGASGESEGTVGTSGEGAEER